MSDSEAKAVVEALLAQMEVAVEEDHKAFEEGEGRAGAGGGVGVGLCRLRAAVAFLADSILADVPGRWQLVKHWIGAAPSAGDAGAHRH